MAEEYEFEYGSATVELHSDAATEGDRVLLIDDLIATGGTMMAGKKLLERLGATVVEGAAIVDLPDLGGSAMLRDAGLDLFILVQFDGDWIHHQRSGLINGYGRPDSLKRAGLRKPRWSMAEYSLGALA